MISLLDPHPTRPGNIPSETTSSLPRKRPDEDERKLTYHGPVEYAFKAITAANIMAIGIRGKDCAVVLSQKKVPVRVIRSERPLHERHTDIQK